jgi:hypothetical protein
MPRLSGKKLQMARKATSLSHAAVKHMFKAAKLSMESAKIAKIANLRKRFVTSTMKTTKASAQATKLSQQALGHLERAVLSATKSGLIAKNNKLRKIIA